MTRSFKQRGFGIDGTHDLYVTSRFGHGLITQVGKDRCALTVPELVKNEEGQQVFTFRVVAWFPSYNDAYDYLVDQEIAAAEAEDEEEDDDSTIIGVIVDEDYDVQALNGPRHQEGL